MKRLSIQALRRMALRRRLAPAPDPEPEPEPAPAPEPAPDPYPDPDRVPEPEQGLEPQRFVEALNALGIREYLLDSSGADAQGTSRNQGAVKTTVSRLSAFVDTVRPETAPTVEAVLASLLAVTPNDISTYINRSTNVLKRAPSTVPYLLIFAFCRS